VLGIIKDVTGGLMQGNGTRVGGIWGVASVQSRGFKVLWGLIFGHLRFPFFN
jgi:hypothetical protein